MRQTTSLRSGGATLKDRVDEYERALITEALAGTRGNQRQAAFHLGVLPTTLHEKMKRLGMIAPLGRRPRVAPPTIAEGAIAEGALTGESLAS